MITLTADKVRIFRKDKTTHNGSTFATYSFSVSSKDKDGNWVSGWFDAVFPKGTELNDKTDIKINNAFPIVSPYNGKAYVKWYIKEFEKLSEGQPAPATDIDGFVNVSDDMGDLPFAMTTR